MTLYEALKAADELKAKGVNIRVMDPFTIKPLDVGAIKENAAACGGRVITVEDHYPEGGIGDAVLDAVADCRNVVVRKLAVNAVPRSGKEPINVNKIQYFLDIFWLFLAIFVQLWLFLGNFEI